MLTKILKLEGWQRPTMWLHLGMALTVSMQLLLSVYMHTPKPGKPIGLGQYLFDLHQWIGVGALIIILMHWIWIFFGENGHLRQHLFPWTKGGLQMIKTELQNFKQGQLPATGPHPGLPGFVHGLGFLAVSVMALTGGLMFFFYPASGWLGNTLDWSESLHKFLSTFVWIYWWGHIMMSFAHQIFRR